MNYVMDALRKKEAEKRLPMIEMEMDYELMTLYDAMQARDEEQIVVAKEMLQHLHRELSRIL